MPCHNIGVCHCNKMEYVYLRQEQITECAYDETFYTKTYVVTIYM